MRLRARPLLWVCLTTFLIALYVTEVWRPGQRPPASPLQPNAVAAVPTGDPACERASKMAARAWNRGTAPGERLDLVTQGFVESMACGDAAQRQFLDAILDGAKSRAELDLRVGSAADDARRAAGALDRCIGEFAGIDAGHVADCRTARDALR